MSAFEEPEAPGVPEVLDKLDKEDKFENRLKEAIKRLELRDKASSLLRFIKLKTSLALRYIGKKFSLFNSRLNSFLASSLDNFKKKLPQLNPNEKLKQLDIPKKISRLNPKPFLLKLELGKRLTELYELILVYGSFLQSGVVLLMLWSVLAGYLIGNPLETSWNLIRICLSLCGVLLIGSGAIALTTRFREHQATQRLISAKSPKSQKNISPQALIPFVVISLTVGFFILTTLGNKVSVLGVIGVLSYYLCEKHLSKNKQKITSFINSIPNAIPGSIPVVLGYAAASGKVLTPAGVYLFCLLFFWQVPHFLILSSKQEVDPRLNHAMAIAKTTKSMVTKITIWCAGYIILALLAPFFIQVSVFYLLSIVLAGTKLLFELNVYIRAPLGKRARHFFIWVNLISVVTLAAAVLDRWIMQYISF
ncbi:MAG: UbiA family prenyltransferase [Bdellovibrionota bacterium]